MQLPWGINRLKIDKILIWQFFPMWPFLPNLVILRVIWPLRSNVAILGHIGPKYFAKWAHYDKMAT